jgi:hypothetical protein
MSPFSTWIGISDNEKNCSYSTRTKRPIYNFSRIPMASRVALILINMPLTIEKKNTQALGKNQMLLQE